MCCLQAAGYTMMGSAPSGHNLLLYPLQCKLVAPLVTCLSDATKGCRTCRAAPNELKCASCLKAGHIINAAGVVSRGRGLGPGWLVRLPCLPAHCAARQPVCCCAVSNWNLMDVIMLPLCRHRRFLFNKVRTSLLASPACRSVSLLRRQWTARAIAPTGAPPARQRQML